MSFRNALNKRTYAYVRVCACYVYVCMYVLFFTIREQKWYALTNYEVISISSIKERVIKIINVHGFRYFSSLVT